ncbi:unnamed protein product [Blepharisma stoltei]|uniref:EGF-like domain-containing protein n=1 Tax=Blepharisma stoltei TaxID=1481888 RepID=A0AAU9JNQ8_9CILI|nr:unnamed protein product [Blepharisma stoltei]
MYLLLLFEKALASCDASCSVCSSNLCSSCTQSHSLPSGTGCVCYNGFYDADSSTAGINCQACDSDCFSCYGPTSSNCLACADSSRVQYKGSCSLDSCPDGTFEDVGRTCTDCDVSCKTCTALGSSYCTECAAGYIKNNGQCVSTSCPTGQYLSNSDGKCYDCTGYCSVCNQASLCTTCNPTFTLTSAGTCGCTLTGFSIQNGACKETCGKGVNRGQLECDDGNTISGDGCSSTCTIESGWTCEGKTPDVCERINYDYGPYATLDVLPNNTIQISFNLTLKSTLTKSELDIYVDSDKVSYKLTKKSSKEYIVKLHLQNSINDNSDAVFKFDESQVIGINGKQISNPIIDTTLYREEVWSTFDSTFTDIILYIHQGVLIAVFIYACKYRELTLYWIWFTAMVFIGFLPMINFDAPDLLNNFLRGIIPLDFIFPNVFGYSIHESSYTSARTFMWNNVDDMQYSFFLVNAFKLAYIFFALVAIFIIAYFGVTCKIKSCGKWSFQTTDLYRYNAIIRFFIVEYLEIGIYSVLQILYPGFDNFTFGINTLIGYASLILLCTFTIFMCLFISLNKAFILDKQVGIEFYNKFGTLSNELNLNSQNPYIHFHHIITIIRKIGFIIGVFIYPLFYAQLSIVAFFTLIYIAWIFYAQPYYNFKLNLYSIIADILLLIILVLGAIINSQSVTIRYIIMWTVIAICVAVDILALTCIFKDHFSKRIKINQISAVEYVNKDVPAEEECFKITNRGSEDNVSISKNENNSDKSIFSLRVSHINDEPPSTAFSIKNQSFRSRNESIISPPNSKPKIKPGEIPVETIFSINEREEGMSWLPSRYLQAIKETKTTQEENID